MDSEPDLEPQVGILVVDDRREDLMALEGLLESREYHVVTALTAKEALRQILKREFAVILLDVMMPEMDGFELASLIKQRERSRHTPIIFLTAAGADVGSIYRAYSVGAVDYLVKPIDRDIVKAKVGTFVELFRKDERIRRQAEALREADRRERDLALAELDLKNKLRYHNLADAIPEIVWTARANGAPDYFNRRWFEYTALTNDEALGNGWLAAVHPDDAAGCWDRWRKAAASGETFVDLCRLRRGADGVYRWHQLRAVPERDDRGTLLGWIGTLTDFEDLKRALDARDDFISVASHELKTPMTALQLNLQGLRRVVSSSPSLASHTPPLNDRVDKALGHVQRLVRLVDELLDVSRITAGRLELQIERCDLAEIARDVSERMADQATRAGCPIKLRAERRPVGNWDRMRLEQVMTNLLSNAFRYAPGEPVEVSVEEADGRAIVRVKDGGPGIPQRDQIRIFERFERASRRQHGGLGMGLYICREIARAHGGGVAVSSEPGRGCEFAVDLPLRAALQPPAQASA